MMTPQAQLSQTQLELGRLDGRKKEMESTLAALTAALGPMGLDVPLVDADGYPRGDVDVYQIRQDRHRLITLQNDYKALLGETELVVQRMFALKKELGQGSRVQGVASSSASTRDSELNGREPFALVNAVSPDSPASSSGLIRGDRILSFGGLSAAETAQCAHAFAGLATLVPKYVDKPIKVVILRGDQDHHTLFLTPRTWSGRGLLGCHLLPLGSA